MVDAIYSRGNGGVIEQDTDKLVDALVTLNLLRAQLTGKIAANKSENGLGVPVYSFIYDLITEKKEIQVLDPVSVKYVTEFVDAPKEGVNYSVWKWIQGAINVNSGEGFYASFIREYTKIQFTLRGGDPSLADDYNQEASNRIALRLATDILGHNGSLPGALRLGAIDAGAATADVINGYTGNDVIFSISKAA